MVRSCVRSLGKSLVQREESSFPIFDALRISHLISTAASLDWTTRRTSDESIYDQTRSSRT